METLIYLSKSTSVLALFYGVYYIFLRKETLFTANRHFLLMGIIVSFLLPLVAFYKTVYKEVPVALKEYSHSDLTATNTIQPLLIEEAIIINWWQVALVIYTIGVLFFLIKFIKQLISLSILLKNNTSKKIRNHTYIKITDTISPFSFFNYIVYNPLNHSETELKMILKHEEAHASQWHSIDIIICNLLVIFQWVNPFAWLYKKSIEENLEFIADNTTVQKIRSKKQYQIALVRASSATIVPALVNNFYPSFIKKRIIMLNKRTSKKSQILKATFILPFLALFLWSFNVEEIVKFKEAKTVSDTKKEASISPFYVNDEVEAIETKQESKVKNQQIATIEKADISSKEKDETQIQEKTEISSTSNEYRVEISKTTSDAEFQKIKQVLKNEYTIDFNYSAQRNSAGEIITLSINYSGAGNSGSYSVTEDNDEPIEDFTFFINPEGESGFYSESMEVRKLKREGQRLKREEHRMEHEHGRVKSELKREHKRKEREEIHEHIDNSHTVSVSTSNGIRSQNHTHSSHTDKESISINKNTTNAQLNKVKARLKEKGIDFNFKKVKRNNRGEITGIKITVNNHKGSKTSTIINSDEAIDVIIIEI